MNLCGFREAKAALEHLIKIGCRTVILTLGDKGALIGSKGGLICHIQTDKVTPKDTTVSERFLCQNRRLLQISPFLVVFF